LHEAIVVRRLRLAPGQQVVLSVFLRQWQKVQEMPWSHSSGLVDFRQVFAYPAVVTEANSAPGKIIYLGACLIAAVRLAREEDWRNSPRVVSRIGDAISLAQRIYERMKTEYPALR
jgi:hypothetical protein